MTLTSRMKLREEHARHFLMLQKVLAQRFRDSLPENIRHEMGEVTVHQMEAMGVIARGPVTMGELAAALGSTSMSAMTQLADRLVKCGLVERQSDPHDRRVVRLALVTGAKTPVSRYIDSHQRAIVDAFEVLNDDELETLMRLVEKLANATERGPDRNTQAG